MYQFHHFRPIGEDCVLQSSDGRTVDQFIEAGFKVEAYLPGYSGEANSVAIVLSKSG